MVLSLSWLGGDAGSVTRLTSGAGAASASLAAWPSLRGALLVPAGVTRRRLSTGALPFRLHSSGHCSITMCVEGTQPGLPSQHAHNWQPLFGILSRTAATSRSVSTKWRRPSQANDTDVALPSTCLPCTHRSDLLIYRSCDYRSESPTLRAAHCSQCQQREQQQCAPLARQNAPHGGRFCSCQLSRLASRQLAGVHENGAQIQGGVSRKNLRSSQERRIHISNGDLTDAGLVEQLCMSATYTPKSFSRSLGKRLCKMLISAPCFQESTTLTHSRPCFRFAVVIVRLPFSSSSKCWVMTELDAPELMSTSQAALRKLAREESSTTATRLRRPPFQIAASCFWTSRSRSRACTVRVGQVIQPRWRLT